MRNNILSYVLVFLAAVIISRSLYTASFRFNQLQITVFIIGAILLLLAAVRHHLGLILIIFFLFIPFTLGRMDRFYEILKVYNFFIPLVFTSWLVQRAVSKERGIVRSPLNAPVFAFVGLTLLQYLRNPRPPTDNTNISYVWALGGLMTYLLASNIPRDEKRILQLRHVYFVTLNIGFLFGLYAAFTGKTIPQLTPFIFGRQGQTLMSSLGVKALGIFGFTGILFLLCQPSYISSRKLRALFIATYASFLPFAGGRANVTTTCATILFFCLMKKKYKWFSFLLLTMVVLFLLIMPHYRDSLPLPTRNMFTMSPEESRSSLARLMVWKASWEVFKESPIIGIGFGRFEASPFYKYGGTFSYRLGGIFSHDLYMRNPHNAYVAIARSLGIIGFGIFLWMLFVFFKTAIPMMKSVEDPSVSGFAFFLVTQTFWNLVNFMTGGTIPGPGFYLPLGLISAIHALTMRKTNPNVAERRPFLPVRRGFV